MLAEKVGALYRLYRSVLWANWSVPWKDRIALEENPNFLSENACSNFVRSTETIQLLVAEEVKRSLDGLLGVAAANTVPFSDESANRQEMKVGKDNMMGRWPAMVLKVG